MVCEIVIVDDDPEFASAFTDVLGHEGHEAEIFGTHEAARRWSDRQMQRRLRRRGGCRHLI